MMDDRPIILGFVDNLMISTRIESVVENLGLRISWMDASLEENQTLLEKINQLNPSLILIDLDLENILLIRSIKLASSTQQIPILCFGSHKNVDAIKEAYKAGADKVAARSKFFSSMPKLILDFIQ